MANANRIFHLAGLAALVIVISPLLPSSIFNIDNFEQDWELTMKHEKNSSQAGGRLIAAKLAEAEAGESGNFTRVNALAGNEYVKRFSQPSRGD
jgi:hypothetical protein